jgi:hypothetical protein
MSRRLLALLVLAVAATAGVVPSGAVFTAGSANPANRLTAAADWVAPSVTLADPGSPLRGTVTLAAAATDLGSGVARVRFHAARAGSGSWTQLCDDTTLPYTCTFDSTTLADGAWDLRAVATDSAGNTASSVVAGRTVDNSAPTVALTAPGSPLRGAVTLSATAVSPTGVQSIAFQVAPRGASTWTTICTDATAPYSCAFDTTTVADGLYDLRAVMTPTTGSVVTSTVAARRVDNSAPRGADVQATNKAGGQAGKLEPGDLLTLSWSEDVKPSTLVPGWDGSGSAAVTVAVHGAGAGDTLDFAGTAPGLGTIALHGNYVNAGKTVTFQATASLAAGTTVTITLGAQSGSGSLRTSTTPTAMEWVPSSAATDLAGNPCSTATIAETGGADKDF